MTVWKVTIWGKNFCAVSNENKLFVLNFLLFGFLLDQMPRGLLDRLARLLPFYKEIFTALDVSQTHNHEMRRCLFQTDFNLAECCVAGDIFAVNGDCMKSEKLASLKALHF